MKVLSVTVLCAFVAAASCASLEPRNEAAELLMETAQLDSTLQANEQAKRSFGGSFGGSYGSGSGGHGGYTPALNYEEPHVPEHYPKQSGIGGDLWGFKRAIMSALFSAAKAVAGGSIAVKGQVIKGAGNLVAAQGRLIATGGQAVSDFGRGVASNALHSAPTITYHPSPAYVSHTASVGYASPAIAYGAPTPSYSISSGHSYASGPAYHNQHNDGVLPALYKAGAAKVNVATAVGSAVGNAAVGAAGAVAGAVGSAAAGAARLAVGAAGAVSNHVAHKFAGPPAHHGGDSHQSHPGSYIPTPSGANGAAHGYNQAYAVPTFGGSLEDSFGQFDDSYQQQPYVNIQPSLSYDLHH